jgi:Holliday junction resolvasome RuvABC endonuclease subunit
LTIIAIDLSTKKIAIASGRGSTDFPLTTEVVADGARAADRFDQLMDGFRALLNSIQPVACAFIEDISFVRGRRAELDLAKVLGGVMAHLVDAGIPYVTVNNMVWKRDLGLGGKATKAAIAAYVAEKHGDTVEIASQDSADALCVLEWGIIQYRKGTFDGQELAEAPGG